MKSLKKTLALVVALAMVFSTVTFAFADETVEPKNTDKAQVLYDLNKLFEGTSTEEFAPALELPVTREQAIKLIVCVLGEKEAAENYEGECTFTDVSEWAKPYIAYALDNGITKGAGGDFFDAQRQLTGKMLVTFFLRALGYEKAGEDLFMDGTAGLVGYNNGLITMAEAVDLDRDFIRDDLVGVAYNALGVKRADADKTLFAELLEKGAFTEENVRNSEDEDLVALLDGEDDDDNDGEFAVESVEALNLKQLQIVYTQEVDEDSATDHNNYKSSDRKKVKLDSKVNNFELQEDGKTVIVTLKEVADQRTEVDVTIDGVKDVNKENTLKDVEIEDVEFYDRTFPEILSADVVGKETIKVTFNEPINVDDYTTTKLKAPFELRDTKGDKVYVRRVEYKKNFTEANVEFRTPFKEDTYTLTILPKCKDYAGFTNDKEEIEIDVVKDEEAPEIVDYKDAKPYEVTLIFNEDIRGAKKSNIEAHAAEIFYHTNSSQDAVEAEVDGNEVRVIFVNDKTVTNKNNHKMPVGTVYVYVKAEKIEDLWGNKNLKQLRFPIEITGDDEAPELEKVEYTEEKVLELTFNEDLDIESAKDKDNYKLYDKDGKEVKIIKTATPDDKKVKLDLRKEISGDYTIEVKNIKDQYENEVDKIEFDFNAEDASAPDMDEFEVSYYEDGTLQIVEINFKDKMATEGKYSVLDLDKYIAKMEKIIKDKPNDISNVELSDIEDDIDIEDENDAKKVVITLDKDNTDYRFIVGDKSFFQIARVADAADNKTTLLARTFKIMSKVDDKVGADKFEIVSETEAKLKLTGLLSDFDENDFEFYKGENDLLKINSDYDIVEEVDDDKTVVRFILTSDEEFDSNGKLGEDDLYVKTKSNPASITERNNEVEIKDLTKAKDKIKPEFTRIDNDEDKDYLLVGQNVENSGLSNNQFKVEFNEGIKEIDVNNAAHDFEVTLDSDDKPLVPTVDYTVELVDGKIIKFTLKNDNEGFDGEVEVATVKNPSFIKDNNDNKIKGEMIATTDVWNTPEVIDWYTGGALENKGDKITIKFNEELCDDSKEFIAEAVENGIVNNKEVSFNISWDENKLIIENTANGKPISFVDVEIPKEKVVDLDGHAMVGPGDGIILITATE